MNKLERQAQRAAQRSQREREYMDRMDRMDKLVRDNLDPDLPDPPWFPVDPDNPPKIKRKPGRPKNPARIMNKRTEELKWFNDQTGNVHEMVKLSIYRGDDTFDTGDYGVKRGLSPLHPTTGKPLPELRGYKINPQPAGTLNHGRVYVQIKPGFRINVAANAWREQTGERLPPRTHIEHIDGNPWNNHISNLRVVARERQHQAITRIAGKVVSLGMYPTREAARAAIELVRSLAGLQPSRSYVRKDKPQTVTTAVDQSATL